MADISFYHSEDVYPRDGTQRVTTNRLIPSQDMIIYGLSVRSNQSSSTSSYEPVVYRASDQALIARGSSGGVRGTSHQFSANTWWTMPFLSPVLLQAGVEYRIGAFALGPPWAHRNSTTTTSHEHIASSLHAINWIGGAYDATGGGPNYPATTTSQEMNMRVLMEPLTPKGQAVNTYIDVAASYYSQGYNIGTGLSFNSNVVVTGAAFNLYLSNNTSNCQFLVYNTSGTLLASSPVTSLTSSANVMDPFSLNLSSPLQLVSGTQYIFSIFSNNNCITISSSSEPSGKVYTSSKSTITATRGQTGMRYVSNGTYPASTDTAYTPTLSILFKEPNLLPNAPTGVSVSSNVSPGGNPVASWTHNDPDGDSQAGYQIRWRKV